MAEKGRKQQRERTMTGGEEMRVVVWESDRENAERELKGRKVAERWRRRRGIERGLHCIATISSKHTILSLSRTLLHPALGDGPWPASVFYLYPVAQHPGGVHDFVSRKTGCVYREMRKTLRRELNHRNSYIPRPTADIHSCVHP